MIRGRRESDTAGLSAAGKVVWSARAILWDLDGTLVDSKVATMEAIRWALRTLGHDARGLRPSVVLGPPLATTLQARGLNDGEIARVRRVYRSYFVRNCLDRISLIPGVFELVAEIYRAAIPQAIVTNRLNQVAQRITKVVALGGLVDATIGRTRGRQDKRAVVGLALRRLQIESRCGVVLVGDRGEDIKAGMAFGLATIGVKWGYATPGELRIAPITATSVKGLRRLLLSDVSSQ